MDFKKTVFVGPLAVWWGWFWIGLWAGLSRDSSFALGFVLVIVWWLFIGAYGDTKNGS